MRPAGTPCSSIRASRASTVRVRVQAAIRSSSSAWLAPRAAWFYPQPTPGFELIADAVAVMPRQVERCTVDGETVRPQEGGFYGGWVTDRVVGPFKGGPGTLGW